MDSNTSYPIIAPPAYDTDSPHDECLPLSPDCVTGNDVKRKSGSSEGECSAQGFKNNAFCVG